MPKLKPAKQARAKKVPATKRRKMLITELDRVVSLYVRARDRRCVICGSTENLQCGHLITRGRQILRFDLDNCNAQCASCNLTHNTFPEIYTKWFIENKGLDLYNALVTVSQRGLKKWTEAELQDQLDKVNALLEDLGGSVYVENKVHYKEK